MRLRRHIGKVKGSTRELQVQFVNQLRAEHGSQGASHRLISEKIVSVRRRQIKPIVQWRLIQQPSVIDEITYKKILIFTDAVIDADESIVGVIAAKDAAEIRFRRQSVNRRFNGVDRVDVGQDR